MPVRLLALSLLLLSTACAAVRADDWIVDNVGGVDSVSGYRLGRSFKSIQFALSVARPGDRIILTKTDIPYREEVSISGSTTFGFLEKPIEILGSGAVLEGADPIPANQWEFVGEGVFRYLPRLLSHQMLYLDGRPARHRPSTDSVRAELQPLEWTQHDGWIYFRTEPTRAPFQYDLACCARAVGITLYRTRNVRISDLVVQGFQLDGVSAPDLVENAMLAGCTLRGNGRSGASVGGASKLTLHGCLVGDNGHSQCRTEGLATLTIESCDIIEQEGTIPLDHQGGVILRDGESIRR